MRVAVFSAKPYDRQFLDSANATGKHHFDYFEPRLSPATVAFATGFDAVCGFANDRLDREVIAALADSGIKLVVLRCAGFNNVDLDAAHEHGIPIGRVPSYSPNAIAEHAFALLLTLVRKTHRAHNRIREGNFSIEGLLGFNLLDKTIGIIGVGAIGSVVAKIAHGFGCRILGYDPVPRAMQEVIVDYVDLNALLRESDIVTLHCPLDASTHHLIGDDQLQLMKPSAILVNTSRGAVLDTRAVIAALKRGTIGGLAIDVYEEEETLFFDDHSAQPILDDQFVRLMTFPNVIVTGHQGFFTKEAMRNIAATTVQSLDAFERAGSPLYPIAPSLRV